MGRKRCESACDGEVVAREPCLQRPRVVEVPIQHNPCWLSCSAAQAARVWKYAPNRGDVIKRGHRSRSTCKGASIDDFQLSSAMVIWSLMHEKWSLFRCLHTP